MPRFNSISISGYHMQEAGATADQELAFTIADGLEYVRTAIDRGLDVDEFAGRLSLLLRHRHGLLHGGRQAAGRPPAVAPGHDASSTRRTRSRSCCARTARPSGVSLTEQDPYNNVDPHHGRGAGRGARRHPEPPHQRLRRGARPAHRLLGPHRPQHAADPRRRRPACPTWSTRSAASYYVEALTHDLADKAWAIIEEVEELGGMTKAVESGMPKLRIEESAARRQARVDRGEEVVVGVNKYLAERPRAWSTCSTSTTRRSATSRSRGSSRSGPTRDDEACDGRARGAREGRGRRRQPARAVHRRRPGPGHRRRDERRAWRRCSAATRPRSVRSPACTAQAYEGDDELRRGARRGRRLRRPTRAAGPACSS